MALTDGVVGSWSFNNSTDDASGNGHTLVVSGAIFDATTKKLGSHSGFYDGVDDRMQPDDSGDEIKDLDSSDLTIRLWVNPDSGNVGNGTLFAFGTNNGCYMLSFNGTERDIEVIKPGIGGRATHTAVLADDTWARVVATYHIATNDIDIWVANSKETDTAFNKTFLNGNPPGFGRRGSNNPFKGFIDEATIWNRILSDGEVTEDWNGGTGTEIFGAAPTSGMLLLGAG